MQSPTWIILLVMCSFPGYSQAQLKEGRNFMKFLLTSGTPLIGKILQPAVTLHGTRLLKKSHKSQRSLSKIEPKRNSTPSVSPIPTTPVAVSKSSTILTPLRTPKKAPEYVGPFRNIPKKNWKRKSGSLGLHDPVPQELFYELERAPNEFWERYSKGVLRTVPEFVPVEVLLGLGRCLNEAALLTFSPSGRTMKTSSIDFVNPEFFAPQNSLLFQTALRRFDVKGDYRVLGDNMNVPFNPLTWNIKAAILSDSVRKKRALGLCMQLRNNTAFTVMTPRYTEDGKVRRNSALVQDLEQKCSLYPYTFLSSLFIPG
ncbi:hypothetical protein [Holospora curviuscula]|uniref:Uncharacterized protein n=1 Tax=Holospora curviuscula TaxID=1082868 RepID=A0A2S5RIC8_9PROT|nr:hypothetical protein [Holospora curviuscula]PPE06925.1 hypothetical protein HCUR_00078 [Holospora curviuscula]